MSEVLRYASFVVLGAALHAFGLSLANWRWWAIVVPVSMLNTWAWNAKAEGR
jgi:hypothetical protein